MYLLTVHVNIVGDIPVRCLEEVKHLLIDIHLINLYQLVTVTVILICPAIDGKAAASLTVEIPVFLWKHEHVAIGIVVKFNVFNGGELGLIGCQDNFIIVQADKFLGPQIIHILFAVTGYESKLLVCLARTGICLSTGKSCAVGICCPGVDTHIVNLINLVIVQIFCAQAGQ